jgi:hypothetical protein
VAIQSIKRWQWIAMSLALGLVLSLLQRMPRENWAGAYGESLTQRQFEDALVREYQAVRHFRDLIVYPEQVQDVGGARKTVHIVAGKYFGGRLEMRNGQQCAIWRPRCYIAEVPYQPMNERSAPAAAVRGFLSLLTGSPGRAMPRPPAADPNQTVLTYLNSLKEQGVRYRYAWWRDPRWATALWTGGSVVLIGLIWPTIVNLLVYGSIFRPREEKGIDLSKVRSTSAPAATRPGMTEQDLAAVARLESELESKLGAGDGQAAPPPGAPAAEPVRKLTATQLEAIAAQQAAEQKEFGADEDDFYPTERHTHPKKEPDKRGG